MNKIKYLFYFLVVISLMGFIYALTYTFMEPKAYDFMIKNVLTEKLVIKNPKTGNIIYRDNKKMVYGSDEVVLVVVDDETVSRYRWPWKREIFCKIFNYFLDYAKPSVVVHDAIMSTLDKDNPESDRKLFKTYSQFDNLVEGFIPDTNSWKDEAFGDKYDKQFSEKFALKNIDIQLNSLADVYQSLIPFPQEYFDSVKYIGSVISYTGFLDGCLMSDEIFRTQDYLISYKGNMYPSLALQTFLKKYGFPKMSVRDNMIEFPEFNYKIKQKTEYYPHFSLKKKYKMRWFLPLKFYKLAQTGYSHQKYSAIDIMDSYDAILSGKKPKISPSEFEGKIVVVGANVTASEGLLDAKNSPMRARHPGVDIQATSIDNILHNDFLTVIPLWANIIVMLFCMIFVYLAIRFCDLIKAITLVLTTIFVHFGISSICFYNSIVVNVITPIVMIIVTMILAYIHRYLIENQNKKKVENLLGKYMSEDVMKTVIGNIDNLGLGGKKSVVSVLFSDIRGFTSLSERMSAEEVTELLNEYFTAMEPIVRKYNGIINKFIGDAIMAIFGEPIKDDNHPENAVLCGYEMLLKVKELSEKWKKEGKNEIQIGIGINTGDVFVGNIGSVNRMEYTVIGDTVNLASRLESYNKVYHTNILISSQTFEYVKNKIVANRIPDVEIRGKQERIDIFEVIDINKDIKN